MPDGTASLLIASNRGPVSFSEDDDGSLVVRRGGGGLVSGLSSLGRDSGDGRAQADLVWVCAALTDADRLAARRAPDGRLDAAGHDTGGVPVRMLEIDPTSFHRAYNGIANSTLWFVHHLLWDIPNAPVFDSHFAREWSSYLQYNRAFADALAADAAPGAKVLVQDYHLTLVPAMLREQRPDLLIGHFSHTPWAPPDYLGLLPGAVAREVMEGILGADRVSFHSPRWADAFVACCASVLGSEVDPDARTVSHGGRTVEVAVHPLGVDADELRERAARDDVEARLAVMRQQVGDRLVVVRVDRTELSKNITRGLLAYRELLRTRPEWHGRVVHVALAYPSRHDLPAYREYTATVQRLAGEIVEEFGADDWRPLVLSVDDDYARSLAAYRRADVMLVNPIRDGMNLVAKEAPIVSDAGCALVLSSEAGAVEELRADALVVNPYDVSGTATALHEALAMTREQRRESGRRLAATAASRPPSAWLADQLAALG